MKRLAALACCLALLTACGGGGASQAMAPGEAGGAVSQPQAAPSPSPSAPAGGVKPVPSPSAAPSAPPSTSPQPAPSASPAPAAAPLERVGQDILTKENVVLCQWQWVDSDRVILLLAYSDNAQKPLYGAVYSRKQAALTEVYRLPADLNGQVVSVPREDRVEFNVGAQAFTMGREPGDTLEAGAAVNPADYLPAPVHEFTYHNLQISADERYYIYERVSENRTVKGQPASDRVFVDSDMRGTGEHPVAEIVMPFDARTTEKTVRWLYGSKQLLIQAKELVGDDYNQYETHYYVYDCITGGLKQEFTLPEAELEVVDTHKARILFGARGAETSLFVYDYKTGERSAPIEFVEPHDAKFSPDGSEIGVIKWAGDLVPAFFPVALAGG